MDQLRPHVLSFFKTLSTLNKWSPYLLSALESGEASSTEISRRVAVMTRAGVYLAAGSVNEAAKRLVAENLIESNAGSRGKVYRLTPKGNEMLVKLMRLSEAYKKIEST